MENIQFFYLMAVCVSLFSFVFAWWTFKWVKKQPSKNARIAEIGSYIRKGAYTFLRKEYTVLSYFTIAVAFLIFLFLPSPIWSQLGSFKMNITMALSYIAGTIFSAVAGVIGIQVATVANIKTAEAAKQGIAPAFMSGFRGGAVMGMAVVGSTLLGVVMILYLTDDTTALLGFSFGASALALFAKAGGGIFTKTADLSADLVGKVELGIPEDDPRNPAVIADNVGDNVGDCAGMGADLFDSNIASLSAALVLAVSIDKIIQTHPLVVGENLLPNFALMVICYAIIGLISSIIGILTAKVGKSGPTQALNSSTYVTTFVFMILTAGATYVYKFSWHIWLASMVGLFVGVIIGIVTDYYTNDEKPPVQKAAKSSQTGPALNIIFGTSYGFLSVLPAMVGIGISALAAYTLGASVSPSDDFNSIYGFFGIAMAAVGMLSIVGMIISNDAYGPIVDNARGLAEMGGLGEDALATADKLDSAGNTVKAITKGFAISAAGLTVISLLGAFKSEVNDAATELTLATGKVIHGIDHLDITNPIVFFGMLVGAAVPAVFSAMLMLGVSRNAEKMIAEIHRQFKEIVGLKEGKAGVIPEYDKCIEIATIGALKELIPAGLMAILVTLAVGFIGGVNAIGGYICGNIVSGLILAIYMSNAGGLWDNAKKYVESGNFGGKGSDAHKAAVIGDTVGDPFKDTAGPSINTQITVVSLVSSLSAILFLSFSIF